MSNIICELLAPTLVGFLGATSTGDVCMQKNRRRLHVAAMHRQPDRLHAVFPAGGADAGDFAPDIYSKLYFL